MTGLSMIAAIVAVCFIVLLVTSCLPQSGRRYIKWLGAALLTFVVLALIIGKLTI